MKRLIIRTLTAAALLTFITLVVRQPFVMLGSRHERNKAVSYIVDFG